MRNKVLVIAGPTAVGKTKFAIEMAKAFDGEIVSCDSMQIYKYMDIGSAKPSEDELKEAVHHLVDFADPREHFSVADYQKMATACIDDILSRGKLPIISGGTGLYLNSLIYDMDFENEAPRDIEYRRELNSIAEEQGGVVLYEMLKKASPEAAGRIHENNTKKIIRALERIREGEGDIRTFSSIEKLNDRYDFVLVALTRDRQELYDRINRRVEILFDMGLVDEVRGLMDMGLNVKNISMKGIGYKEVIEYLEGNITLDQAVENVQKNTRRYSKRQLTWFRRYDKMCWLDISEYDNDDMALEALTECLKRKL